MECHQWEDTFDWTIEARVKVLEFGANPLLLSECFGPPISQPVVNLNVCNKPNAAVYTLEMLTISNLTISIFISRCLCLYLE